MTTRIAISGVTGRMGRAIIEACSGNPDAELVAAIAHPGSRHLGADAGELAGIGRNGVSILADIEHTGADFDVLIDFSTAEALAGHLDYSRRHHRRIVIGTTGLDDAQKASITRAADETGIVYAPNMSIGVNLAFKLVEIAAGLIGEMSDIEIIEAHHRMKKDAPSGTAVRLGEIIAARLGRDLKECAVYGRVGVGTERDRRTIGFETIRAGDIVGDHTVLFASQGERLEITHKASSRMTFATGAVVAAVWLMQVEQGLYDMQDVLGLR